MTEPSPIVIERVIGRIEGVLPGPTLVFIGGIHGNEPAGLMALQNVFDALDTRTAEIKGTIYGLSGNMEALLAGQRYIDRDLNRIWTENWVHKLDHNGNHTHETIEQRQLWKYLTYIIKKENGPFYFIDLHTTSCQTIPFMTVNDTLLNRKFTANYPVPMVLGIEEYLKGPLLSYINSMGYIAFGFEGGQHESSKAIQNHEDFIYMSLGLVGCIDKEAINYQKHFDNLQRTTNGDNCIYEIFYREQISEGDHFTMIPGFQNFQPVSKHTVIATAKNEPLPVGHSGKIFMPLYQAQGDDGFFLIRPVHTFFLWLSKALRKFRMEKLLTCLPGISQKKGDLLVNKKVARFFTKEIFHLLGYRVEHRDDPYIVMHNREIKSKNDSYKNASWNR